MFAAIDRKLSSLHAAFVFMHNIFPLNKKRIVKRWWQTQFCGSGTVYSGVGLLADLSSKKLMNNTQILLVWHPADFEFQINLIGPKTAGKDTTAVPVKHAVTLRFLTKGDACTSLQPLQSFETNNRQNYSTSYNLRWLSPGGVFSMSIVILGISWIPEHRLSFEQFCGWSRVVVIPLHWKLQYAKKGLGKIEWRSNEDQERKSFQLDDARRNTYTPARGVLCNILWCWLESRQ